MSCDDCGSEGRCRPGCSVMPATREEEGQEFTPTTAVDAEQALLLLKAWEEEHPFEAWLAGALWDCVEGR